MSFSRKIKDLLTKVYMRFYSISHKVEKKILFDSFGGKQYSDNPRAICERMHELYPEFELVWVNSKIEDKYGIVPTYVKMIERNRLNFYQQLATSFCYITNENINNNIIKRKKQFFVQTWHGDIGIKKVLYDACPIGGLECKIVDPIVDDLCIAGSDIAERMFRTAFRFRGEVLKKGTPRNDKLAIVDMSQISLIKSRLKIDENIKVMMYAPTYRDNSNSSQKAMIDISQTLSVLEETGEKWICLIRAHSASKGIDYVSDFRIIDVTDYPDMADLLLISDLLISDYSSCAGDFILTGRPTILFLYDQEEYKNECRGFVFEPSQVGFIVADTQERLSDILRNYTISDYKNSCDKVKKYFNMSPNIDSSKYVCEKIHDFYEKHF